MERLFLHVPAFEELQYRQKLMADPATMAYNGGYDLDFSGYHPDSGCIDFPESEWKAWYDFFVGAEPERWYAYIARKEDGAFLGEVNVHRPTDEAHYEMGIVLEARYRGKGYAAEALRLLLHHTFEEMGAQELRNSFEETRQAALRTHLACGFRVIKQENGMVYLGITKKDFNTQ